MLLSLSETDRSQLGPLTSTRAIKLPTCRRISHTKVYIPRLEDWKSTYTSPYAMSASSRNGHLEEDHSDGDSLISVTSEEFPHYFIEREGRLFHSSPTAPYPLPVDTPEQEVSFLFSVLPAVIAVLMLFCRD